MEKEKIEIILGTAHLRTTPGKRSPDGTFREYSYSRERVEAIKLQLEDMGYTVFIDYESPEPLPKWAAERDKYGYVAEQREELKYRAKVVNSHCGKGKQVIYVSVHTDAMGGDGMWHCASGFTVRVSPKASKKAKTLAKMFTERAKKMGMTGNRVVPKEGYVEQNIYVLNNTKCPAVLTETGFQDNKREVAWLLSSAGKHMVERLHVEAIAEFCESL